MYTPHLLGVGFIKKIESLADVRSESGIVASIICMPELINFSENLSGEEFTDKLNGVLYDTVKELYENDVQQIDAFNIVAAIGANEKLKKRLGGEPSIDTIADIVDNSKYIARGTSEEYIMLVSNVMGLAYRRALYNDLSMAQDRILRVSDITQLQRDVSSYVERETEKYVVGAEIPKLGDNIDSIWEEIEEKQRAGGGYKLSCVPQLNSYFTIERQELIVFMGKMKAGKSMFLMNVAMDLISQGAKVLYLDTELSDVLFTRRLISYISGVEADLIKRGGYNEIDRGNIIKARQTIRDIGLYHLYIPNYSSDSVYATIKTMQKKCGIDTVIFDYLKPSEGNSDAYSTYASLGDLTNLLKNKVAGDMKLHVLTACQASRSGQVADSIRIAQYCSCLVYMEKKTFEEIRTDGQECGNYKFKVRLNRLGAQMDEEEYVSANFIGSVCRFIECKQSNPEDIFG